MVLSIKSKEVVTDDLYTTLPLKRLSSFKMVCMSLLTEL